MANATTTTEGENLERMYEKEEQLLERLIAGENVPLHDINRPQVLCRRLVALLVPMSNFLYNAAIHSCESSSTATVWIRQQVFRCLTNSYYYYWLLALAVPLTHSLACCRLLCCQGGAPGGVGRGHRSRSYDCSSTTRSTPRTRGDQV